MMFLVDCTWTTWMYGECSTTCGEGTVAKTRSMNTEMFGGLPCEGSSFEFEPCKVRDCPTGKTLRKKLQSIVYSYLVV